MKESIYHSEVANILGGEKCFKIKYELVKHYLLF